MLNNIIGTRKRSDHTPCERNMNFHSLMQSAKFINKTRFVVFFLIGVHTATIYIISKRIVILGHQQSDPSHNHALLGHSLPCLALVAHLGKAEPHIQVVGAAPITYIYIQICSIVPSIVVNLSIHRFGLYTDVCVEHTRCMHESYIMQAAQVICYKNAVLVRYILVYSFFVHTCVSDFLHYMPVLW